MVADAVVGAFKVPVMCPLIVIEFLEPVSGPIAVGYGAHFGLGLFVPV